MGRELGLNAVNFKDIWKLLLEFSGYFWLISESILCVDKFRRIINRVSLDRAGERDNCPHKVDIEIPRTSFWVEQWLILLPHASILHSLVK